MGLTVTAAVSHNSGNLFTIDVNSVAVGAGEGAAIGIVGALASAGIYRAVAGHAPGKSLIALAAGGAIAGGLAGAMIGANAHPGPRDTRVERAVAGMFVLGAVGAGAGSAPAVVKMFSRGGMTNGIGHAFREVGARFAAGAIGGAVVGALAGALAMGYHFAIVGNDGH